MPSRPKINQQLRKNVYKKNHGCCYYCGCELSPHTYKIDHFFPYSRGGSSKYNNLVPSCTLCNSIKADLSIEDFRRRLEYLASSTAPTGNTIRNKFGNDTVITFSFELEPPSVLSTLLFL